jgi:hypothetical protein
MLESIFDTKHCRQCGRDTSHDGVTEYYELRHTHIPQGDERIEIGGGRTMPMPNFDLATPNALSGIFCSARCLTDYVVAHIAPDAAGE